MKPYIISINGLDGSGKETTSKLLIETLKKDYKCVKNIEYVSFPDYTSKTGEIIKEILSGDYTHLPYKESSLARPYEIAKVFAANRTMYFANHPLQDDTIYIFDRYKESNILYQGLGRSGRDLLWFAQFLKEIDEENPDPNLSIFLQVPYMELRRRLDMREIVKAGIEHDHYEDDSFRYTEKQKNIWMLHLQSVKHDSSAPVFSYSISVTLPFHGTSTKLYGSILWSVSDGEVPGMQSSISFLILIPV